jgi:uncharacterized membrane protein
MTEAERSEVQRFLQNVRRGLRGLPKADIEDTVEEMRTHLFEEIGERGDAVAVLTDFGDAAEVASEIVQRRLRPDEGRPVPSASLGRRYSAWATDVVVGLGPMLLVPTAITFAAYAILGFGDSIAAPVWIQLAEHVAYWWLTALGYSGLIVPQAVPLGHLGLGAVLLAWAAFYWLVLRRGMSKSLGMWMTGLRAVRLEDDLVVVRERDIAQNPAPLGAGRGRWWVLVLALPTGCLCIVLLIYYLWMCIGPFLPPRILG